MVAPPKTKPREVGPLRREGSGNRSRRGHPERLIRSLRLERIARRKAIVIQKAFRISGSPHLVHNDDSSGYDRRAPIRLAEAARATLQLVYRVNKPRSSRSDLTSADVSPFPKHCFRAESTAPSMLASGNRMLLLCKPTWKHNNISHSAHCPCSVFLVSLTDSFPKAESHHFPHTVDVWQRRWARSTSAITASATNICDEMAKFHAMVETGLRRPRIIAISRAQAWKYPGDADQPKGGESQRKGMSPGGPVLLWGFSTQNGYAVRTSCNSFKGVVYIALW